VSREDVVKAIPPRKQFTIADLAAASGASTATVRKVVTDLVSEGKVQEAGTAEAHEGPGRAPTVYKRTRK
jgi:predicted ArsR family transcriptional regulator